MFEQTSKNIGDILFKDAGADSELDYIGQTSWVMFLRYLHDLEQDKADIAALQGKATTTNTLSTKRIVGSFGQCQKLPMVNSIFIK